MATVAALLLCFVVSGTGHAGEGRDLQGRLEEGQARQVASEGESSEELVTCRYRSRFKVKLRR